MNEGFVQTNGIRLHYLDHPGGAPTLVLLPGLTANAHAFDGLIAAGLSPHYRVIAPDLRGRGLSDQPTSYTLADHAADVLGMLDALELEQVVLGGHSFGGLMTLFLAAHAPARFSRLIVLDAAMQLATTATRDAIQPSLARLGQVAPSWDAYHATMQAAPFFAGWWDSLLDEYYRADVETRPDGSVKPRSQPAHIAAVMDAVIAGDWASYSAAISQRVLLLCAVGAYGPPGAPPVLNVIDAKAMATTLADCQLALVPGNHMTMLYAEGARRIVQHITAFLTRP